MAIAQQTFQLVETSGAWGQGTDAYKVS